MSAEYILYKGEEVICLGSLKEISKHQGVAPKTVAYWASPIYKKRIKDRNAQNAKVVFRIED